MDTALDDDSVKELTTRKIDVVKIPVIPLEFLAYVEALVERGDRASLYKIAQFEVPVFARKNLPVSKKIGHWYVCEIDYDEDIGVKTNLEHPDPSDSMF